MLTQVITGTSAGINGVLPALQRRRDTAIGTDHVQQFTDCARQERHVSASTLESYTLDLAMLSRWAAARDQELIQLTTTDLTDYVTERASQGTRLSTLARHVSSFRRFYAFLLSRRLITSNPAAYVVVSQARRQPSNLVRDDVLRSLLQPSARQYESPSAAYRARRDHAIVCMLYSTGLGISDVRLLRWQQISQDWRQIQAPTRNGSLRTLTLDATTTAVLGALHEAVAAQWFDGASSPYCFPTASRLPMTRQALCHVVRRWASECGQAEVTPSALRQTGRANQISRARQIGAVSRQAAPALA